MREWDRHRLVCITAKSDSFPSDWEHTDKDQESDALKAGAFERPETDA
jgi:hypothetical protein